MQDRTIHSAEPDSLWPIYAIVGATLALAALLRSVRAVQRLTLGGRPEDVLALAAAVIETAVQGTGMWRFFESRCSRPARP